MNVIKYADNFVDHIQVNIDKNQEKSLSIENNSIKSFQEKETALYSIRVWKNNKEGFASGNKLNKELVKKAIKIAKLNANKEYFYGIPNLDKYKKINNFDKKLANIDESILVDEARKIIKDIVKDNVILSSGAVQTNVSENCILNSNGINICEKSTEYGIGVSTVAKHKGKVCSWFDDKESNQFFTSSGWGQGVNEKTLFYLNAKKLSDKPKVVILNPEVFSELAKYSLLDNFNGKNVEKHKSLFCGKINENIMKNISIHDNGLKGMQASSFDDEGTASKNTCIVDKGKLKNFIFDHNTATHTKTKTTGNSSGGGIAFSNVYFNSDKNKIPNGLLIESIMGAHTGNSLTSDFSVQVEHAIYNGKPIKDFMISGKMINVLNNVIGIDKNVQQEQEIVIGNLATDCINVI